VAGDAASDDVVLEDRDRQALARGERGDRHAEHPGADDGEVDVEVGGQGRVVGGVLGGRHPQRRAAVGQFGHGRSLPRVRA
jgi:hypothetical protein